MTNEPKRKYEGVKCGATGRQSGQPCKRPAGWGTNHPGSGRCKLHGGVGQVNLPGGRYDDLRARPRLKELVAQYAAEADPLDLTRELVLLRALVQDYVERYDDITAAVLNWHASFTGGYIQAVQDWRNELADWAEQKDAGEDNEPPAIPVPVDFETKPRQMMDITAAAGLLDKIGGMADRVEKRKREGVITMATLDSVLEQLGVEVVGACQEVGLNEIDRTHLLTVIERRWGDVRVDPGPASGARPPTGAGGLN